jgi:hypothetical protein
MSWLSSFFVAILTGIVAAVAGGFVAAGCVEWYHISSHEGGSDLFSLAIGFFSGIGGFAAGLILSRFIGSAFLAGLGICAGGTLGVAGVAALIAYGLADIPPTLNGHALDLIVEFRLPKGAPDPSASPTGKETIELYARNPWNLTPRKTKQGTLQIAEAKQVEGRWIIPGSVWIFTTRGPRGVSISFEPTHGFGFELEFPRHPGQQYQQWSEWLPRTMAGKPWPDTEMSYRFRIEEQIPGPPIDPAIAAEAEFAALTPDAPLDKWLSYLKDGVAFDREQAVMKVVEERPGDLAKLMRAPNFYDSDPAMYAVTKLKVIDPEILQTMRDIATEIEEQIRKFNAMKPDQSEYYELSNDIRYRFKGWSQAWWNVHRVSGLDGRPPLEEIIKLASVQKDSGQLQEVVLDAEAHLGGLRPATK